MSLSALLDGATRQQRTVSICFDGQAIGDLEELVAQRDLLPKSTKLRDKARTDLEARIDEARARAEAGERPMVIQTIGAYPWTDLTVKYPPEDDGRGFDVGQMTKTAPRGVIVVGRAFVPAVISACLVEPTATLEEAERFVNEMAAGTVSRLWEAIVELNNHEGEIPKSARRSEETPNSAAKLTTAPSEESHTASSSAA